MNKVILIGRLARDPEIKYAAGNGTAICRFSIAVTRPFKKDETDFISCIAFGKTGETIAQYLTKGRQIAIAGSIRTGSYDAQDGRKIYTTDVVIDTFEFIGSGQAKNKESSNDSYQNNNWDNGFGDVVPSGDSNLPF